MRKQLEDMLGIHTREEFLKVIEEKYKKDPDYRLSLDPSLYRLGYKRRFDWNLADSEGNFSLSRLEEEIVGKSRRETNVVWTKETILYCVKYFVDKSMFSSENPMNVEIRLPSGDLVNVSPKKVYNIASKKRKMFSRNNRFVGLSGLVNMACGEYIEPNNMDLKEEVVRWWYSTHGFFGVDKMMISPEMSWAQIEKHTGRTRRQIISEMGKHQQA